MNQRSSLRVVAGMTLLLSASFVTHAQAQVAATAPDARVETALKAAQLGFLIDEGDFRLDYKVDATRSQRVWIASATTSLPPLEIRDVWSVAARGKGTVPADLAVHLLQENVRMVLGAWQVNQGKDEYLVVFSAQVNADADAAALREVIEVVMYSADRIEKELSGKDEF
ncbi:MAG: hypothetical protein NTU56_13760 [Proteobacteria bacterium]|nr:hypothetical protein [Pseudomonadota bacterium]